MCVRFFYLCVFVCEKCVCMMVFKKNVIEWDEFSVYVCVVVVCCVVFGCCVSFSFFLF